ncbi:MBL fold metallo-hydrolase [Myxococcota bacterium]|nr:MBL fold metallo-hydrolase [Myxococcota bacterium]
MVPRSRKDQVLAPQRQWSTAMLAGIAILTFASGAPATEIGPAPTTEDGRFENPGGPLSHGSFGVRFSFFMRRMAGAFGNRGEIPDRIDNDGAFLRENAGTRRPTVTWVGHATLLVQMDGVSFLTDPIWSRTASPVSGIGPGRFVPPGIKFEDLPPIDFVVVSHNHYDHLDLPTLEKLARRSPDTRFLVPLGNAELLESRGIDRVEPLNWGESVQIREVTVYAMPAQHWSQRGLTDRNRSLWASWAVVGPERRFYFAGDTGYFDGFRKVGDALGPFDIAAVPIGAYRPVEMMREAHMNPEEAVQAALDVGAGAAVAIHFGTFDLATEPLDEPPIRFREAGHAADQQTWVLDIGETRDF